MRRITGLLGAAALAASGVLYAQSAALKPVEALPDPVRPVPAEVGYAHPLFAALDDPPKIVERPNPADLETRVPLVLAAHVLDTGKVSEFVAVEPPLKALTTPLATLAPKWRYAPPKKGGKSVGTWAAQILDLNVSLEKGVFSAFQFEPVREGRPDREGLPGVLRRRRDRALPGRSRPEGRGRRLGGGAGRPAVAERDLVELRRDAPARAHHGARRGLGLGTVSRFLATGTRSRSS